MTETEDYDKSATPTAHKTSHQDGGSDEISVAGLSGLLGDAQTPLAHKTSHQDGGLDEISIQGLSGLAADDQHVLDAEAVSAMGAKANTNPLNHDRYADSEALAAAVQSGAITDAVTKAPTHDAVYDVKVMTEDHSARHEAGGTDVIDPTGWFQKARAYRNAPQIIPDWTWTKIGIDTDSFDPANISDLPNNRITPTKAGYYIVIAQAAMDTNSKNLQILCSIYKNGSSAIRGNRIINSGAITSQLYVLATDIIYLNGTTDYLELWIYEFSDGDRALEVDIYNNYLTVLGPI